MYTILTECDETMIRMNKVASNTKDTLILRNTLRVCSITFIEKTGKIHIEPPSLCVESVIIIWNSDVKGNEKKKFEEKSEEWLISKEQKELVNHKLEERHYRAKRLSKEIFPSFLQYFFRYFSLDESTAWHFVQYSKASLITSYNLIQKKERERERDRKNMQVLNFKFQEWLNTVELQILVFRLTTQVDAKILESKGFISSNRIQLPIREILFSFCKMSFKENLHYSRFERLKHRNRTIVVPSASIFSLSLQ